MKKLLGQQGFAHTFPLLLIVAIIGIISFLLISSTLPLGGLFGQLNPKPASHAAPISSPALIPLPSNWPFNTLQIGIENELGDVSSMTKTAPFGFRYHYLTSGAATCQWCPWPTWGSADGISHTGDYVNSYIQESINNNMTPTFSYYNMLSYSNNSEGDGEITALNNASAMRGYFNDLKLFMQLANKFPTKQVILHFEPDLWGYIENHTTQDDATTVPAQIAGSGMSELSALPNNAAGLAQGVVKLRDLYAPNVIVAFHMSTWGTLTDFRFGSYSDPQIISVAQKSATFFNSLNANYDLLVADPSDHDAAYFDFVQSNPNAFWDDNDYHYSVLWISTVSSATNKRFLEWQIPVGNQQMRAENNTTNHYQDNQMEKIFADPSHNLLNQYINAGVVAFLFGPGNGGASNFCDCAGDGVTNPSPITYKGVTNNISSILGIAGSKPILSSDGLTLTTPDAADDDGGFFRWKAYQYYQAGAVNLTAISSPSPSPAACPKRSLGDTDCNGVINIFDYNILIGNFGKTGTGVQGDLDQDGKVGIFDYNLLLGNFGH